MDWILSISNSRSAASLKLSQVIALCLLALVSLSASAPFFAIPIYAANQDSSVGIGYELPQYGTFVYVSADIFTQGPNAFSGVAYYGDRINFTFAQMSASSKISFGVGFQNANATIYALAANSVSASSSCPSGFCYEYYHYLPNATVPNQVLVNNKLVRQANFFTSSSSFTSSSRSPAVYLNSSFNSLTIRFSQGDPTIQVINTILPCNGINNIIANVVGDYSLLAVIMIISVAMVLMKIFFVFYGGSSSSTLSFRAIGARDGQLLSIAITPVRITALVTLIIVGLIAIVGTQSAILNSIAC